MRGESDAFGGRVGTTLRGKWTLERLIGVGGMSAVYVGLHKVVGRRDAIKILRPEVARVPELVERFEREAHAVNRFRHPGAVAVHDFDRTEDGVPFLVMELLEGRSLAQLARRNELPPRDVLRYAADALDVLAAAHEEGIVHRDVKPDNLFITREGVLKVLDFGIARVLEGAYRSAQTATGEILGTPYFMAPEQVVGRKVDARADVFAAGATMFRLLSGRHVHEAPSEVELVIKAAMHPAPPFGPLAPHLPPSFGLVIDRALAFRAEDRYPDARTMQADVRALWRGEAPPYATQGLPAATAPAPLAAPAPIAAPAAAPATAPVATPAAAPAHERRPARPLVSTLLMPPRDPSRLDASRANSPPAAPREPSHAGLPPSAPPDSSYAGTIPVASRELSYADAPREPSYAGPPPAAPREPSYAGPPPAAPRESSYAGPPPAAPREPSYAGPPPAAPRQPSRPGTLLMPPRDPSRPDGSRASSLPAAPREASYAGPPPGAPREPSHVGPPPGAPRELSSANVRGPYERSNAGAPYDRSNAGAPFGAHAGWPPLGPTGTYGVASSQPPAHAAATAHGASGTTSQPLMARADVTGAVAPAPAPAPGRGVSPATLALASVLAFGAVFAGSWFALRGREAGPVVAEQRAPIVASAGSASSSARRPPPAKHSAPQLGAVAASASGKSAGSPAPGTSGNAAGEAKGPAK